MMKIISAQQVRQADENTIINEPISSLDLMERAAKKVIERLIDYFPDKDNSFSIFCGIGNNGGDGLVIYRLLSELGYKVNCIILEFSTKRSKDFKANYERLKNLGLPVNEIAEWGEQEIQLNEIVIDAVLGIGTDRPAQGVIANYIKFINKQPNFTISIDIPSGMYSDEPNAIEDIIFKADIVFTFEQPKLGLFLPPNENYIGALEIISIGLSPTFIESLHTPYSMITDDLIQKIRKPIENNSHKGSLGHLALIAGQRGMMGAAVLSSKSAMRSGVGKCTVFTPTIGRDVIQITNPEVLVNDMYGKDHIQICPDNLDEFNAIAIGPGIGVHSETELALEKILHQEKLPPMVLDADALNTIAQNDWIDLLPENSIITPHPGEFIRLFGSTKNRLESIRVQREKAQKHKVIIVLKGHHTSIGFPDGSVYINNTGNAGLATAGSGDVLTGIIGSLLAQGYSSKDAALFGVYLHGLSGDLAVEKTAKESLIASDIISFLSKGFSII
jgi:NAD(P)H-hydrate epimerase